MVAQFLNQNYARVCVTSFIHLPLFPLDTSPYVILVLNKLLPSVLSKIQHPLRLSQLCYKTTINQASRGDIAGQGKLQYNARIC